MASNIANQSPYLRTSREFPKDLDQLTATLNKIYLDIANGVNARTIGIYPTNKPVIIGDSWFIGGHKFQALRQIYEVTGTGTIEHRIDLASIKAFTHIYGTFTDGTNWYPLPYVDAVAATNQVSLYVDPTFIQIIGGGGGGQPVVQSGFVVLEWISYSSTNLQA